MGIPIPTTAMDGTGNEKLTEPLTDVPLPHTKPNDHVTTLPT